MIAKDREILKEFKQRRAKYKELEQKAAEIIDRIIADNNFFVMTVSHRTKESDSLKGKLQRKSGKYNSLVDITDLVGIRVICYFNDTVDKIARQLGNYFTIDWGNSIDKRAALQDTQFGYMSLHYICYLPDNGEYDKSICGIPFEIQMRTVLQHTWAEIEHDLGYKSDFGVPRQIRRMFSQVAGLLEVADRQFVEIRDHSEQYTLSIREKIKGGEGDSVYLDNISLREYLRINDQYLAFAAKIKNELGMDIENIDPESYLEQLSWFGVESVGDLNKMFADNEEYIFGQLRELVELYELDIVSSSTLLRHLCNGELIREGYSATQMRKFLSISIKDEKKLQRVIDRLMK